MKRWNIRNLELRSGRNTYSIRAWRPFVIMRLFYRSAPYPDFSKQALRLPAPDPESSKWALGPSVVSPSANAQVE